MSREFPEETIDLRMSQPAHSDLAVPRVGLERGHLLDPLPFALRHPEYGADQRHVEILRTRARTSVMARDDPVDHVPAHLVWGQDPLM